MNWSIKLGRISGIEPAQLANVQVYAWRPGAAWHQAKVDYDGRYRISDVEPGTWTVEASDPGSDRKVRDNVEVAAGVLETSLDLEFHPGTVFAKSLSA